MSIPYLHTADGVLFIRSYRPLSSVDQEIRLLTVAPGPWDSDILCELHHAPLNFRPEYEALSYTWGDQNKRRDIWIDGFRVSVTINLEVALRHLRYEREPRVLWADAVCINQQDNKEKSEQVQIMRDIYNSAHKVLAWTGEASYDSDEAMDLILEFWRFTYDLNDDEFEDFFHPKEWEKHGFDPSRKNWTALQRFCERPYWSRIWILQEISYLGYLNCRPENDRCVIHCGRRSIAREQFGEVCMALLLITQKRLHPFQEPYWTILKNLLLNFEEPAPALRMMQLATSCRHTPEHDRSGVRSLLSLMRVAGHFQATMPQDKIFALLGLCIERDRLLQPDYTRPVVDIYMELVQSFMERDHNLDCLLGNRRFESGNSPSWIPDNLVISNPGPSWSIFALQLYRPGGDRECRVRVDKSNRLLTVQGVRVGLVQDVMRFANDVGRSRPSQIRSERGYFTPILSSIMLAFAIVRLGIHQLRVSWSLLRLMWLVRSFDEVKHELMWRTLIMDIDRPLLYELDDLEDVKFPASERFRDMYKAWAGVQTVLAKPGESLTSYLARGAQFTNEFAIRTIECIQNRCLFFTKCGRMGIGAVDTRRDDVVCILFGSPFCFILRPCGSRYQLVGEAYVQGIMRGELFDTDAPRVEEDFVLC
jgi:hypothetical protein